MPPKYARQLARARAPLTVADEVGLALRDHRRALGLSQRAYAASRGLSRAMLAPARGRRRPDEAWAPSSRPSRAPASQRACAIDDPTADDARRGRAPCHRRSAPEAAPPEASGYHPSARPPTDRVARVPMASAPHRCTPRSGRAPSSSPGARWRPTLPGAPRHRAGRPAAVVVATTSSSAGRPRRPSGTPRSTRTPTLRRLGLVCQTTTRRARTPPERSDSLAAPSGPPRDATRWMPPARAPRDATTWLPPAGPPRDATIWVPTSRLTR